MIKMIKSMTAYANATITVEDLAVSTEIRSFNSRFLDISLHITRGYLALENKIKTLISDRIARGRVEINIQIKDESEEGYDYELNIPRAKAFYDSIIRLKEYLNIDTDIPFELLVNAEGIIKPVLIDKDMDVFWPTVQDCIVMAMDELIEMRKREGEFIAKDIELRLDWIEENVSRIENESEGILLYYQQRLKDRIEDLTRGVIEIDPLRIAQEAAFIADKSDISEEIIRTVSHIRQFRKILNAPEPAGRKLNFLLQELHRELNTIGSKTEKVDISHIAVGIKSEIEKIREQVQNIE